MARLGHDPVGCLAAALILGVLALGAVMGAEVRALVAVRASPRQQRLAVRLVTLYGLVRRGWCLQRPQGGVAAGAGAQGPGTPTRGSGGAPAVAVGRMLRYLLGPPWRVGMDHLRARVRVGTGDPAATAVAFGALHGLIGAGLALLGTWVRTEGQAPRVEVQLDYGKAVLWLRAGCIVRTRLGHLILALALGWWAARRRRVGA
jgi:hypothetical protein